MKLSASVQPAVETAIHPDRILLDFPDTVCAPALQKLVNMNGVRRVRAAQHSTNPPVTRVVVDLDRAHLYTSKAEGNQVILTVSSNVAAREVRPGAPAAAVSGGLIGIFRKQQKWAPVTEDKAATSKEPAAPLGSAALTVPSSATASPAANPAPPQTSSTVATVSATTVFPATPLPRQPLSQNPFQQLRLRKKQEPQRIFPQTCPSPPFRMHPKPVAALPQRWLRPQLLRLLTPLP